MDTINKNNFVKNIFQVENEELINKILKMAQERVFKTNDIIQNIGEKQTRVYLIYQGLARSFYLDINGNDITKMFMKENDFCIGESLFENAASRQGVEAIEEMQTLEFDARELKRLLLSDKHLIDLYIRYLENSLIYKMQRESSFQIMNATERYLRFQKDYKDIENRVNQSYIASYLGIAPESLSRIKRTIKEEN